MGALTLPAGPTAAEAGDPRMSVVWSASDYGDGSGRYSVDVACLGVAPGAAQVVVACYVDGLWTTTTTPGQVGVGTFTGSSDIPITVCAAGTAMRPDLVWVSIPTACSFFTDTPENRDTRALLYVDVNTGRYEVDRQPGTMVKVPTPYSLPELLTLACGSLPEWLQPWCLV